MQITEYQNNRKVAPHDFFKLVANFYVKKMFMNFNKT